MWTISYVTVQLTHVWASLAQVGEHIRQAPWFPAPGRHFHHVMQAPWFRSPPR